MSVAQRRGKRPLSFGSGNMQETDGRKRTCGWATWLCLALVGLWIAVVCWVSLTSAPPGEAWLVALSRRFSSPTTALRVMQAVVHLALYGIGAFLVSSAIARLGRNLTAAAVCISTVALVMAFGVTIEFLQDYVPRRRADLVDLSGDLVGTILSLSATWTMGLGPFRGRRSRT
ncbi:VanZ family protein [Candidatus Sumerlaeota bacterium]|nr:VanZ family protein [Candidatus Sumerlaeota bacterium]